MILNKKQMTEEDIKLNYITPAINASGWKNGGNIITWRPRSRTVRSRSVCNMAVHEKSRRGQTIFST